MRPGEPVFLLGSEGAHLYIIVSGIVTVAGSDQEKLSQLGPSQFFGDESVFSETVRPYSVSCEGKVQLLSIARSHLLAIIYESPSVALQLLREYAKVLTPERRFTSGGNE